MPKKFSDLVRESVFRPKDAARYIVALEVPKRTIIEAAVLMSILVSVFQYGVLQVIGELSENNLTTVFPYPFLDVAMQFVSIYVVNFLIVILARGAGIKVDLYEAIKVYLWFNFVLTLMMATTIMGIFALGPFVTILGIGLVFWVPFMVMSFWSVLLNSNLGVGFVVPIVAFIIASAFTTILASALNLPLMEYVENV